MGIQRREQPFSQEVIALAPNISLWQAHFSYLQHHIICEIDQSYFVRSPLQQNDSRPLTPEERRKKKSEIGLDLWVFMDRDK